jgi:protein phosphatase 1 regulatory subunit 37
MRHTFWVALVEVLQAGIMYIAQVLKRNRTLKVLNLSENKLEVAGLVAIAEGLVRFSVRCMDSSLIRNPL